MTKVEELRQLLCEKIMGYDSFAHILPCSMLNSIDSLIAAAREEGAGRESRRWLDKIELAVKEGTLGGFVSDALDNASVLSPAPKEPTIYAVGDNGESGESHSATSSGGYWKATYVPPPEMTFDTSVLSPAPKELK